ncbi:carboxypeptidase regulatory-like domain-containing protein [Caulobacter sp. 602-1]|uniref:TonB-dependent receptor n=1 Tax=Caulobacter sp. 602-1 TaxID=2492472 RepID=UPI000F643551|nr:carboxypeptidase regulatory-like domain-containing protein [Caulobacter sp. 602-1]RRN66226.1 TonB-dependent receptor [Caulobacter sp. 602-1]
MGCRTYWSGAAFGVMMLAAGSAAHGQESSSNIHGVVTLNGAPVANAGVAVVHTPSGTRAFTSTEASGVFDLRGLRVGGPYTITVTGGGQPPKTLENVFLRVTKTEEVSIDLAAEETVEAVVVTASGTRNSDQGPKTVLGREAIAAVASVARDPRDLARRDILVSQDLSGGRAGANAGGISIAGSNPRFNRISVDGVSAQDSFGLAQGGMTTTRGPVTLDAIEQFSIAAVPTDVENGDFVGGAMNIVLRSGANRFHGTAFVNYLNDGMVGRHLSKQRTPSQISQKNYGGFLSGPIIKDKLFFAAAYETYRTSEAVLFGAPGSGAPNIYSNGLTQATIDAVKSTFDTNYASDYAVGDSLTSSPVTDKKYSVKLDWNISDRHRASLTYRYAQSASMNKPDLSATTATLTSHWFEQSNVDEATTLDIRSNWTDRFTTTLKATYRSYVNGQNPPTGQNFSDISVCAAPTSDAVTTTCQTGYSSVRFGVDQFRHAGALDLQEARFQFLGEYSWNGNRFKFGAQARKADVYDLFVPNRRGTYYFDSLADFAAGKASSLTYANAVTGDPNTAAFNSTYWTNSVFAQDTLDITDDLRVTAGVRFDWYDQPDRPIYNPNFTARNGFSNQKTIDGLHILMPRVSAEWTPRERLKINGGFGLFAGGIPDVLTGTPFYNTGYATTQVVIQRNAAGAFTETTGTGGFTQAIGAAALNNLTGDATFGYQIPSVVQQLQQGTLPGATAIPALGAVIALSPTFEIPGQWKGFLSINLDLGKGWALSGDYVHSQAHNDLTYSDYRAQPLVINGVQQFLPDGRIRYDGLSAAVPGKTSTNLGANNDLVATNTDKGSSWTGGLTVSKRWDWGVDMAFGLARQRMSDVSPGAYFGTTSASLYNTVPAYGDPNHDYLDRSVYEIRNRAKFELSFHKAFFGDNETRVTLFAERQDGRPFGFTMQDSAAGRGPVFGVTKTAQALYVPDFAADTNTSDLNVGLVTFATAADLARFQKYVNAFNIPTGLVRKYSNTNAPINRVDLQLSQTLPTPIEGHKVKLQFDVRNLLNLINRDWGLVGEYTDINTLARVDCADANGAAVGASSAVCARYRYSSVPTSVTKTRNTALSLWYMQVSLRYEF